MYRTSEQGMKDIRKDLLRKTSLAELESMAARGDKLARDVLSQSLRSVQPEVESAPIGCKIHGVIPYAHDFCPFCDLQ